MRYAYSTNGEGDMADITDYPEVYDFLDDTEDYENTASETNIGGGRYLIVTQVSDHDGGASHLPLGWR